MGSIICCVSIFHINRSGAVYRDVWSHVRVCVWNDLVMTRQEYRENTNTMIIMNEKEGEREKI